MWIWISMWCHFLSVLRTSFNISCKASLLSIDSVYLCLSGNVFILPTFFKDGFTMYRTLVWFFFPFSTFNMSSLCLLAFVFPDEKSAIDLPGFTYTRWVIFSLASPMIFLLVLNILTMRCLGVDLGGFCRYRLIFFINHVLEVYNHYIFNLFSTPFFIFSPSGSPIMCMLVHLITNVSRFLGLCSFFSFFPSVLQIV